MVISGVATGVSASPAAASFHLDGARSRGIKGDATLSSCISFSPFYVDYDKGKKINGNVFDLRCSYNVSSSYIGRKPTSITRRFSSTRALPRVVASMGDIEKSYIMVKPDGVQRGLVGEIISRFEKKGFKLIGLKLFQCPKDLAQEHYKDLQSKPFFPKLIDYITSGPVVCMAWEGAGVVASARKLIGSTNPLQAEPGTIRGDLAIQTGRNIVHGSDSPENGKREIELWFKEGEICMWDSSLSPWLIE